MRDKAKRAPTQWDLIEQEFRTGSMSNDRVSRLDVKTGQYVEYQLPRPTNIRRVFIDERPAVGVLWIGSNHGASIVKVEPLD